MRFFSASRSGTTTPIVPRSTWALALGRWNCCEPTLTHMLAVPKSM